MAFCFILRSFFIGHWLLQVTPGLANTVLENTVLADKLFTKTTIVNKLVLFTNLEETTALADKKSLAVFPLKHSLSPIYTRQDVTLIWTRLDFLYVAGKSKFLVEHFLMGILSRSWSFCIRTWTRNAKLPRLIRFISFKIWHRYAPRNTTRNATSFWISRYTQKITSGSYQGDVLTRVDWA